jgi:hypothetical protein
MLIAGMGRICLFPDAIRRDRTGSYGPHPPERAENPSAPLIPFLEPQLPRMNPPVPMFAVAPFVC